MIEKASQLLEAGKAIIVKPEHWITGWFARNDSGQMTTSLDPEAISFCSAGAFNRASESPELTVDKKIRNKVAGDAGRFLTQVFGGNIVTQDTMTHEEVLQKWDEAILLAKQAEGN